MLGCEVGKLLAAAAWRAGERAMPAKGYINTDEIDCFVQQFVRKYKQHPLQSVPLCTLAPGAHPGGPLSKALEDLRPTEL